MIFINKPKNVNDLSIYSKTYKTLEDGSTVTRAKYEQIKAIEFFENKENFDNNKKLNKKKFTFSVYKNTKLRERLDNVFKKKCAYCESSSSAVASEDIEHFRPKAKIINQDDKEIIPGYYWLGAEWDNLLLSCQHCNRPKAHYINSTDESETMGKSNYFPLRDEADRASKPVDDHTIEDSLLINPCKTDPSNHIKFNQDGTIEALSDLGENSIEIFGLYRAGLVELRKNTVKEIKELLLDLYAFINVIEQISADNPASEEIISRIKSISRRLKELYIDKNIYLALKRSYLNHFINEHPDIVQKLAKYNFNISSLLP